MPIPRSAVLVAVFVVLATLLLAGTPQRAASGAAAPDPEETVSALRRDAAKARKDLEKATKDLEKRKTDLKASKVKLQETLQQLGTAEAALNRIREPLAQLANASYQQPASGSMAIFGNGSSQQALRSAADLTHLANAQDRIVDRAAELHAQRTKLSTTAQDLQSKNAVDQAKVLAQIDGLKAKSLQLTKSLTKTLKNLDVSRDRRLALSCDEALIEDARKYPNGLIPNKYLCELPQSGERLRADAAIGFFKLNAAYKARFGSNMCITDSYRSLADQQRVYYQRPGFAAIPGRSNHGLGQALDLCGGIQNQGSVQFNWLRANSTKYGWFHPSWAYSSPFEPWHWEFGQESYG